MLGANERTEIRKFDVYKRGEGAPEFMYTEEQTLAISDSSTRVISTRRI